MFTCFGSSSFLFYVFVMLIRFVLGSSPSGNNVTNEAQTSSGVCVLRCTVHTCVCPALASHKRSLQASVWVVLVVSCSHLSHPRVATLQSDSLHSGMSTHVGDLVLQESILKGQGARVSAEFPDRCFSP